MQHITERYGNEQRRSYQDDLEKGLGLFALVVPVMRLEPFVCMAVKKGGGEELWHLIDTQQMISDVLPLLGLGSVLKNKKVLMKDVPEWEKVVILLGSGNE